MIEKKNTLNRKIYKAIKKYDRTQMEEYLITVYQEGFREGAKSNQQTDFKIELVQLLEGIKGVGTKTKELILSAYKERKSN